MDNHGDNRSRRRLIINGEKAERGRYPYFSLVGEYCGGSLIAPDVVMCAGHCIPNHVDLRDIVVSVGVYNRPHNDDDSEVFSIRQVVRHPNWHRPGYDGDAMASDFMLIHLDGRSSQHPLARINRNPAVPQPGQEIIAMGLGIVDSENEKLADTLQQVVLHPITNRECEAAQGTGRRQHISYRGKIDGSMLCTSGGPNNERDACDFDSGSPMIIPGSGGRYQQDTVVAMVSWGRKCADPEFPGVNGRVSNASAWVDATVCHLSHFPPADFGCRSHHHTLDDADDSMFSPWAAVILVLLGCVLHYTCHRESGKEVLEEDSSTAAEAKELVGDTQSRNSYDSFERTEE